MKPTGYSCYCYNEECNQKQWEKEGRTGKRQWTCVDDFYIPSIDSKVPRCPWCKKKMTVTGNLEDY